MNRRIQIDANSILRLLTHYTQDLTDAVPLDAELVAAGVSPYFQRWIMLEVTSEEWSRANIPLMPTGEPVYYHVRYEGRKVGSWMAGDPNEKPVMEWQDTVEAPPQS